MIIRKGHATGMCAILMGNYTFLKPPGAQKYIYKPLMVWVVSDKKLGHDAQEPGLDQKIWTALGAHLDIPRGAPKPS